MKMTYRQALRKIFDDFMEGDPSSNAMETYRYFVDELAKYAASKDLGLINSEGEKMVKIRAKEQQ